ncbi:MAG: SDR family NAD(P)-dependent oxidoreductase [Candidatus Aenigmarchaeota archaeon]|nr:SDR family NAD(P)-dependent oxidoreductase [Candidatus Aenigmarchaeota archaeon]
MRVLVTGGTGFIGSNIAEALAGKGHEVVVLDNFSLGRNENVREITGNVEVVNGDIRDFELLKKITAGCDAILNQAAASSSPMFRSDLRSAVAVNVDGFVNILNAARMNDVKRLVYASSSSIYGNSAPPLREDMPVVPVNFYASTKLLNEHLAVLFGAEYGIETVGFRYMSVYGKNEKSKGMFANLVTQFLWAMMEGKQPEIYGDGEQTRDFTYVRDVVRANVLALESRKRLLGEVFNVGTGKAHSLNELVAIINKILGKNIKPKYVPVPVKNYIAVQQADITKISAALGYRPEYPLESGIRDMLPHYS